MTEEEKIPELAFKPRFLVVDDEKRIREGCEKTLTLEDFEVVTAESGAAALEILARKYFDIILLDLVMPGLSGMEVLTYAKDHYSGTVVIVITGYATLEHAVEAMKKGAFDFISKPFSPDELRDVISKAIKHIRTLEDIAHEKSRARALINHLSAGVIATDSQKKIALANPAALRMMNFFGDAIGQPVKAVVRDEALNELIGRAMTMPSDKFAEMTMELDFGGEGSNEETVLARCVPFRDHLGRNLGAVTVLRDITAQKKVDQLKTDFVSMVAHEIRGPMNTVMAQLKVVLGGLAGDVTPKQGEVLTRCLEKIRNLADLATELLDLARIESGLVTQERGLLNLSEIITEQVDFYRDSAREKEIRIDFRPAEDLPPILGNRHNMQEVFSNLISNAIKYSPNGAEIDITAEEENNFLCIRVRDTGYGIPEDEIGYIFDRFYRVQNDKTRFITGTGLGLAIVRSVVKAHDGMVNVTSKPDEGTSFEVFLPVVNSK